MIKYICWKTGIPGKRFSTHIVQLKKYMQHSLFANKLQNVNLSSMFFFFWPCWIALGIISFHVMTLEAKN